MAARREWSEGADLLLAVERDPDGDVGVQLTTGWKGPSYWTVDEAIELIESLADHIYDLDPPGAAERLTEAVALR